MSINPGNIGVSDMEFDQDHEPQYYSLQVSNEGPKIDPCGILGDGDSQVYSVRFSNDNKYIAGAKNNGCVDIYSQHSKTLAYQIQGKNKVPFTCCRWRQQNDLHRTSNVLLTTNCDGEIQHWHMTTGKQMNTIKENEPGDPQLNNLDMNYDNTKFAVVGASQVVRVYDAEKKCLDLNLDGEGAIIPGHSNRLFSVKFVNDLENPNQIVSGGWDNRIIIWDIRQGTPIDSLYGHNICGDAIDIVEGIMLTCSFTDKDQIQLYDIKARKLIKSTDGPTINWETSIVSKYPSYLYCGQFNKTDGRYILAGGAYGNEAKLFDFTGKHCATITKLTKEIQTCDFSMDDEKFAISGGDGYIRCFTFSK